MYVRKGATEGRERLMRKTSPSVQTRDIIDSWRAIIVNYSGQNMTDPGDKLIAIGALAEHSYKHYGDKLGTYCAGLWYCSLFRDLSWHVEVESLRKRPEGNRAPTWSWAAVDGPIHLGLYLANWDGNSLIEVLSCQPILTSDDIPFGAVVGGFLTLKGFLMEAIWSDDSESMTLYNNRSHTEYPRYDFLHLSR